MRLIRFIRAHLDSIVALALAAAFLLEVSQRGGKVSGASFIAELEADETLALALGVAFLLSLALRSRLPVVPLTLAFATMAAAGRGDVDGLTSLALGFALLAYSIGAWTGGVGSAVGALAIGALAGLAVLRASDGPLELGDVTAPAFILIGAWLLGVGVREIRVRRGDRRVRRLRRHAWHDGYAAPDSAGRDDTVRELREVIERAMSAVILEARDARRAMREDPRAADRSLAVIEASGTEAMEETQRLTSLLLSPAGTPQPGPQPGLADVEFLAEELSRAGLPTDTHVTGRPVPLTSDLDAVAYLVVQEALMAALEGATDATASVHIRYQPDALEIEITDDGVARRGVEGVETDGLEAVRKQVAALGGTLDAGPRDGRGYWVLAQFPYEPDWH